MKPSLDVCRSHQLSWVDSARSARKHKARGASPGKYRRQIRARGAGGRFSLSPAPRAHHISDARPGAGAPGFMLTPASRAALIKTGLVSQGFAKVLTYLTHLSGSSPRT